MYVGRREPSEGSEFDAALADDIVCKQTPKLSVYTRICSTRDAFNRHQLGFMYSSSDHDIDPNTWTVEQILHAHLLPFRTFAKRHNLVISSILHADAGSWKVDCGRDPRPLYPRLSVEDHPVEARDVYRLVYFLDPHHVCDRILGGHPRIWYSAFDSVNERFQLIPVR